MSLNNTNSVGSVWAPRRDDLIEEDSIPELLTELSPDLELATGMCSFMKTASENTLLLRCL